MYFVGIDVAVDVEHNGARQRCGVNVSSGNVNINAEGTSVDKNSGESGKNKGEGKKSKPSTPERETATPTAPPAPSGGQNIEEEMMDAANAETGEQPSQSNKQDVPMEEAPNSPKSTQEDGDWTILSDRASPEQTLQSGAQGGAPLYPTLPALHPGKYTRSNAVNIYYVGVDIIDNFECQK